MPLGGTTNAERATIIVANINAFINPTAGYDAAAAAAVKIFLPDTPANVRTTYDTWVAALAEGTAEAGVGSGVARAFPIFTGATTRTHIGAVTGYSAGNSMFVAGRLVHLTADMTAFKTVFVAARPGTDGAGFDRGNPATWAAGNSRVAHRGEDETWSPVVSGDDSAAGHIWAVVTTDLSDNVLAATLIVAPNTGRDVYRDLPWRR